MNTTSLPNRSTPQAKGLLLKKYITRGSSVALLPAQCPS
jgi:hypothetical protein